MAGWLSLSVPEAWRACVTEEPWLSPAGSERSAGAPGLLLQLWAGLLLSACADFLCVTFMGCGSLQEEDFGIRSSVCTREVSSWGSRGTTDLWGRHKRQDLSKVQFHSWYQGDALLYWVFYGLLGEGSLYLNFLLLIYPL